MEHTDLSFLLNHLGEDRAAGFGAVVPPVVQSGNFAFPTVAMLRQAMRQEFDVPLYTRGANPTVAMVRQKLAALEHAEDALLFGSGSAAMAAAVLSFVKTGDHVVCVKKPYHWTSELLDVLLARFGVSATYVDGRDPGDFREAATPHTVLFILESPNSITFELQDLRAVAAIAKERGIRTVCDNSYCSPLFQNPIDLGIDLVVHSGTKYLNGHSDVVCGVLAGSHDHIRQVMAREFMTLGAIPGPHDAWLLMRGMRTLELRMRRSAESGPRVARFLEAHPKVRQVNWPYLESFPQHTLAKAQMSGCPGLMSVRLHAADVAAVERFCDALRRFLMAVSWGGHESLIFPMAAVTDPTVPDAVLPWDLVRIYVGLEDPELLIADLEQALTRV